MKPLDKNYAIRIMLTDLSEPPIACTFRLCEGMVISRCEIKRIINEILDEMFDKYDVFKEGDDGL